jgi:quercetin dioxygenase-like cupin family protein
MTHRILFLATFNVAVAVLAAGSADEPTGFAQISPSSIKWIPSPVVPGTYRAVLLGNPDEAGPFVMRVKVPPGTRIMPHRHREERVYTVLAGE